MEQLLHRFNPWWTTEFPFPGVPRDIHLKKLLPLADTKDIILLVGMRRVGKTTLLHQIIHQLLPCVDPQRVFYVSLDHLGLKDYTILEVVEQFRSITRTKHSEKIHLFLDEVHMKDNYEIQLKNLYDEGNAKIYASGSASLDITLSSPHLTGRQRIFRLPPLSFPEYMEFTGACVSPADKNMYPVLAEEYIKTGGIPEYVLTKDMDYLQSLVETILYRDVAGRHHVRNRGALIDILTFTAQSVGSPISLRKISNVLGIPKEIVSKTLDMFLESNLIHMVEREGKLSERKASPRKIYLADTGLFNILTEGVNIGAVVENSVYLALRDKGVVRYHRSSGLEVDFVSCGRAWESKYKKRIEEKDLAGLQSLRGAKEKTIITYDKEENKDGVNMLPLWKLLLQ